MKFSICLMPDIGEIEFFPLAERLGYEAVWVADSQMLFSDCYATMALAATQTTTLKLGVGTAICGTRIAPVQVASVATLNRLAPGRIALGIGTGNTAMRSMGQKPMRIKAYAEYLRALLSRCGGNMRQAAAIAEINPVTMYRLLKKRGLSLERRVRG